MAFKSVQTWTIDNEYWAREIERYEHWNDGHSLAETFERCSEEEIYMVRDPPAD